MADENSTQNPQQPPQPNGRQPQQPYGEQSPQPQQSQQPYGYGSQPYQAQPPYGQNPQQPYGAPTGAPYQQPVYAPQQPQPLQKLTGGMKFGWFAVGFLVGIAGILIAWLVNVDRVPQVKSDALKWSIIGAVVGICLSFLYLTTVIGGIMGLAGMGSVSGSGSFSW